MTATILVAPAVQLAADLMTADELAERWGVPKSQVYRLAREGKIPRVRLGKYTRFRLDIIESWEAAGTTHNAKSVDDLAAAA